MWDIGEKYPIECVKCGKAIGAFVCDGNADVFNKDDSESINRVENGSTTFNVLCPECLCRAKMLASKKLEDMVGYAKYSEINKERKIICQ